MPRKGGLTGRSVVITGASSGIGRAAALAFARRGARVTLGARRAELLEEAAVECRGLGADAVAVPTDVTDPDAVQRLARAAEQAFGGVDVWINNAGTGVFGRFVETPLELHRKTVEVDLLGALYGAHAALPLFLRQGRGVLINNISVGGWAPTPYAAAYTAAKFGLRGLSASLRQEMQPHPDIHVCAVFPAMVDTPGLEHGANFSGGTIDPGPLLYAPEDVAECFVRLALHPRDEVGVGWPARAAQAGYVLARAPMERVTSAVMRRAVARADPAPWTEGSVLATRPEGAGVSGGWRRRKGLPSARTLNAIAGVGLAGATVLLIAGRRH